MYGTAILGAGGGGELDEGFALIDQALAAGKPFKLLSVDEVPDDTTLQPRVTPNQWPCDGPLPIGVGEFLYKIALDHDICHRC